MAVKKKKKANAKCNEDHTYSFHIIMVNAIRAQTVRSICLHAKIEFIIRSNEGLTPATSAFLSLSRSVN